MAVDIVNINAATVTTIQPWSFDSKLRQNRKVPREYDMVAGPTKPSDKKSKYGFKDSVLGKLISGSSLSTARADGQVAGTKRNTGAGYTGEVGNKPTPPIKSAKMSATVSPRGMAMGSKASGPPRASTPKKAAAPKPVKDDDYNRRAELGDFYLNATSGMFSPKAGGKKK